MSKDDSELFDSSLDVSFLTPTKPLSASYLPSFGGIGHLFDPLLSVTPEQAAAWRAKQVRFNPAVCVKETSYFGSMDAPRSPPKPRDAVAYDHQSYATSERKVSPVKEDALTKHISPKKQLQGKGKVNLVLKSENIKKLSDVKRKSEADAKSVDPSGSAKNPVRSLRFADGHDLTKVEYNSTLRSLEALRSLETQLKPENEPLKVAFENISKNAEILERSTKALNIATDRTVFRELPGVEVTRSELERVKAIGRRTHEAANRELLRAAAQKNALSTDEEDMDDDAAASGEASSGIFGDVPITDERPTLAFRSIRQQLGSIAPRSYTPRAFDFFANLVW